jgi:hypothetical protein
VEFAWSWRGVGVDFPWNFRCKSASERQEDRVPSETLILFLPFRLDTLNEQLWWDNAVVPVQLTGAGLSMSYILVQLAEAYGKVGQEEEGFSLLTEALVRVEKTGERWDEAELYRLKGELVFHQASQKSKRKNQK